MKIAIIGKGRVGSALGPALKGAGHAVTYGVRDPADPKYAGDDGIALATPADAASGAEIIILSVPAAKALEAAAELGLASDQILIDCNNPVAVGPNGPERTSPDGPSLGERVAAATDAIVVKTLNQVGSAVMGKAGGYARRPIQFVAGNDAEAKAKVSEMLTSIGFAPRDAGGLDRSGEMEGMAFLWIYQAFTQGMAGDTAWFMESE